MDIHGNPISGRKREMGIFGVERERPVSRPPTSVGTIIVYTGEPADVATIAHITNLYANYIHAMGSRTITLAVRARVYSGNTRINLRRIDSRVSV